MLKLKAGIIPNVIGMPSHATYLVRVEEPLVWENVIAVRLESKATIMRVNIRFIEKDKFFLTCNRSELPI